MEPAADRAVAVPCESSSATRCTTTSAVLVPSVQESGESVSDGPALQSDSSLPVGDCSDKVGGSTVQVPPVPPSSSVLAVCRVTLPASEPIVVNWVQETLGSSAAADPSATYFEVLKSRSPQGTSSSIVVLTVKWKTRILPGALSDSKMSPSVFKKNKTKHVVSQSRKQKNKD